MRLGLVNGIVDPAARLLDAQASPFRFCQQTVLGQKLCYIRRKDDMTILELIVVVLQWSKCKPKFNQSSRQQGTESDMNATHSTTNIRVSNMHTRRLSPQKTSRCTGLSTLRAPQVPSTQNQAQQVSHGAKPHSQLAVHTRNCLEHLPFPSTEFGLAF